MVLAFFKKTGIHKYDRFVVITSENFAEWNIKNYCHTNPLWFTSAKTSTLENKSYCRRKAHV
jgi:hypothetical protein